MADACQLCHMQAAAHTHHRKRRSQGGTNDPENLMRLCADCHQRIHDNPDWAYGHGYLLKSWEELTPLTEPLEHEHEGKCEKCGLEIKSKPRKRFKGEARRTRSTISLKVPKDADEDGAAVFDELIEQARELLGEPDKPIYYILVAALYVFVRDFKAEDAE